MWVAWLLYKAVQVVVANQYASGSGERAESFRLCFDLGIMSPDGATLVDLLEKHQFQMLHDETD